MKNPTRTWVGVVPVALLMTAALVACSSNDDARPTFEDEHDAATPPPAAPEDAEAPLDAGKRPQDAGPQKAPFDPAEEPVVCADTPCATALVAGDNHFCARMSDGTVRCWGDDARGALGTGPSAGGDDAAAEPNDDGDEGVTRPVTDLADVVQLSAAGTTTCAVVTGGDVFCWGGNDKGQLGLAQEPPNDTSAHPTPSRVLLPHAAERVDVGPVSACAVLTNGEAWCWGDNAQRQLARVTTTNIGGPGKAELGAFRVVRTAAGTSTGFGITDAGELLSWGAVAGAQAVVAARTASLSPDERPVAIGLGPVTSFSVSSTTASRAHASAVVGGYVYSWGSSSMGALGTGLPGAVRMPTRTSVPSEEAWAQQVDAAGEITCVRLTDGTVQCAGDNATGVLGEEPEDKPFSMFFQPVASFTGHAVHVATTGRAACALVRDGSVLCWGSNQRGELGQGTTDRDPHPTPVLVGL